LVRMMPVDRDRKPAPAAPAFDDTSF